MMELTASTLSMFDENLAARAPDDSYFFSFSDSESGMNGMGGVYVTASMWEDCESYQECLDTNAMEITPEPKQSIPLHVLTKAGGILADIPKVFGPFSSTGSTETDADTEIESTTTAKLFFPDSKLKDGTQYFLTLEFSVMASAEAFACYGNTYAAVFAGAEVGPYIIDAKIVKNADFGECSWLAPEKVGCGLFDKISGSADPDCDGEEAVEEEFP
jgi:hypothetical protein